MIRYNRRFDARKLKLLVFDLDGTLIDSRLDLIQSTNAMLRHVGRPELSGQRIASYVGDGAAMLVRRALANSMAGDSALANSGQESFFDKALAYFLDYYREHKLDNTTVYDGVNAALSAVRRFYNGRSTKMLVLSNKPVGPSQALVEALKLSEFFDGVYGGNSFATKKPDPLGFVTLLQENKIAPEDSVMIGDSHIDVQTGLAAGAWTCGVTYGFDPKSLAVPAPDVLLDHPRELAELFSG